MDRKLLGVLAFVLAVAALPALAPAGEKGHGSMPGMQDGSSMEGHGMMKMGDKVFGGMIGPWHGEARLVDMKAQMEKAKVSEKAMAMMKHTHHVALSLEDPGTKTRVTEAKMTVTVAGPGGKEGTYDLMGMQGHFGADVTLDGPGKYEFTVTVEAAGKKGSAVFSHTVR